MKFVCLSKSCSFSHSCRHIKECRFNIRNIRRSHHKRKSCILPNHRATVSFHRNHCDICVDFAIKKVCQFSASHPMCQRQIVHSDKGQIFVFCNMSFHNCSTKWIRSVKNNKRDIVFCTCFHDIIQS